jgi:hypothetical protein
MIHDRHCPRENRLPLGNHTDAAKRIADTYNLHRSIDPYGHIGKWFASALQDGKSDNVLYDSKPDAIDHQHHNENWYTFIQIVPATLTECGAEVMLKIARMAYNHGWRMTDGANHELIKRSSWEDQIALSRGLPRNVSYGRNRH